MCEIYINQTHSFGKEMKSSSRSNNMTISDYSQEANRLSGKTLTRKPLEGNHTLEPVRGTMDEDRTSSIEENTQSAGSKEVEELQNKSKKSLKRKRKDSIDTSTNELSCSEVQRLSMTKFDMEESRVKAQELGFEYELRSWQMKLIQLIQEEPDDITIYWVYGPTGGEGKTKFARFIGSMNNWTYLRGAPTKTMITMLSLDDISNNVVIDFPRSVGKRINYEFINQVKDRTMILHSYNPVRYLLNNKVHVIVFSNCAPDFRRISLFRIKMIYC